MDGFLDEEAEIESLQETLKELTANEQSENF